MSHPSVTAEKETKVYDQANVFAKILRKEIPAKVVLETEYALAFHDVNPQAPIHVLVIPKGAYVSMDDFSARATPDEIVGYIRAIGETARTLGVEADGYRLLSNIGAAAGQEVPHLHVHIFAGRSLGPMLSKRD